MLSDATLNEISFETKLFQGFNATSTEIEIFSFYCCKIMYITSEKVQHIVSNTMRRWKSYSKIREFWFQREYVYHNSHEVSLRWNGKVYLIYSYYTWLGFKKALSGLFADYRTLNVVHTYFNCPPDRCT